jgi:hypothetical protein
MVSHYEDIYKEFTAEQNQRPVVTTQQVHAQPHLRGGRGTPEPEEVARQRADTLATLTFDSRESRHQRRRECEEHARLRIPVLKLRGAALECLQADIEKFAYMLNGQSKQQVWVPSTPPESESDEEMMSMQEALIMDCAERCAASKSSLRAVRGTPSQWGWTRRNARRTRVPGLRGGGDDALEREERRIDREKRQVEKEEEDRNAPTLTSEDVIHGEVAPPLSPTGTVASTSSWFPGFTRVTPIPPFDTTTQVRSAHLPNAPSTSPPTTRPDPINRRPF